MPSFGESVTYYSQEQQTLCTLKSSIPYDAECPVGQIVEREPRAKLSRGLQYDSGFLDKSMTMVDSGCGQ